MAQAKKEAGCIVGIDFGTTFSGCCYCIVYDAYLPHETEIKVTDLDINLIQIGLNNKEEKVPTVAIYNRSMERKAWGTNALDKINKEGLKEGEKFFEKFKLRLPATIWQQGARQKYNASDLDASQNLIATIDFFKVLSEHAYKQILNDRSTSQINYSRSNMRFVVTVPATWNDTQRKLMEDIAYKAGLTAQIDSEKKLQIVNESLASTLYCEYEMKKQFNLDVGDIYITCDAGGGTVDIAAFVVTRSTESKSGSARCQISADMGADCGSTFIDLAMEELLMKLLYYPEFDEYSKTEQKQARDNVAQLMEQFNVKKPKGGSGIKFNFRKTSTPQGDSSDSEADESTDDEQVGLNQNEPDIVFRKVNVVSPKISWTKRHHCELTRSSYKATLRIPFKKVAEEVFDKVINTTIRLLDTQIEKVKRMGDVKATFLVGGLGNNPYLKQKMKEKFWMAEGKYKCGMIKRSKRGDLATMKGAVYYGLESIMSPFVSNMAPCDPRDQLDVGSKYDILLCYDIGYDSTRFSYVYLERGDVSHVAPLPLSTNGLDENAGANFSKIDEWYQVGCRRFSKFDHFDEGFQEFIRKDLKENHSRACSYLKESGKDQKIRYCITLENSFDFFPDEDRVRDIAVEAELISNDELETEQLLLIKRQDASALYIETQYFTGHQSTDPLFKDDLLSTSNFLQIQLNSGNCHLSLHEATQITGGDIEQHYRNVRCIRKITFHFTYLDALIKKLKQCCVEDSLTFQCQKKLHQLVDLNFDEDTLKNYFYHNSMEMYSSKDVSMDIKLTSSGCCRIVVSIPSFEQSILKPVIRSLASSITAHAVQEGITEFKLDRLFILGRLVLPEHSHLYLEGELIGKLSECFNIDSELIVRADESDQEVVRGAIMYSLKPSIYTERIARRTYMVSFEAFTPRFTDEAMECMDSAKDQSEKYDTGSKNVMAGNKVVNVYYQPAQTPSSKISVRPMDPFALTTRGDKITLAMETSGIQRKFFTEEDAVVYASIYSSETTQIADDIHSIRNLQKIHQFEVYLERQIQEDQDDFGISSDERLHFNICAVPLKNEFKFEATLDVKVGKKIPEFRYRDDFFVANLYNNKSHIDV